MNGQGVGGGDVAKWAFIFYWGMYYYTSSFTQMNDSVEAENVMIQEREWATMGILSLGVWGDDFRQGMQKLFMSFKQHLLQEVFPDTQYKIARLYILLPFVVFIFKILLLTLI